MTPTYDPNRHSTRAPGPNAVNDDPGQPSQAIRLIMAVLVVSGLLLLGWLFLIHEEPVAQDGPAVDEIEQEEDDAIDSTDG